MTVGQRTRLDTEMPLVINLKQSRALPANPESLCETMNYGPSAQPSPKGGSADVVTRVVLGEQ